MPRRAWAAAALLAVTAACTDGAPADDGGTTTVSTAPPTTVRRTTEAEVPLRVGQCGDVPRVTPGSPIDPATIVITDCQLPHVVEIAAVLEFPASGAVDFPGTAAVDGYAADTCLGEFEGYVGIAYADSRLDLTFAAPGAEGWAAGDRRVACILYDADFATLTSSARASAQ